VSVLLKMETAGSWTGISVSVMWQHSQLVFRRGHVYTWFKHLSWVIWSQVVNWDMKLLTPGRNMHF